MLFFSLFKSSSAFHWFSCLWLCKGVTGDTNKFPSLTERGLFLPGAGSEIRAGALNGLRRFTLEPSSNKNIQSIEKPSVKVEKGEEIRETQAPLEMKKSKMEYLCVLRFVI